VRIDYNGSTINIHSINVYLSFLLLQFIAKTIYFHSAMIEECRGLFNNKRLVDTISLGLLLKMFFQSALTLPVFKILQNKGVFICLQR
jgi:hypothetical protein